MSGFLYGVVAGILIMNAGIVWLGYLASDQRSLRKARATILVTSSASIPPRL